MSSAATVEDATMLVLPPAAEGAVPEHLLLLEEEGHVPRPLAVSVRATTLGRAAPSDVVLQDALVSRQHCRLQVENGRLTVTDLGSTNGTTLDDVRLDGTAVITPGAVLRLGRARLTYEGAGPRRMAGSPPPGPSAAVRPGDAGRNGSRPGAHPQGPGGYVQMLLPHPLPDGPVRADWLTLPSAEQGTNAFGYRFLSEDLFAGYMVDVAGQGMGAAMHAVAVMNLLRQPSAPGMDPADPSAVLAALNAAFPQEQHNGMFLLLWYFVLDLRSRTLDFASGGRRPALLVPPGREDAMALGAEEPPVGLSRGHAYATHRAAMPPGSMLYLLSDGASETLGRSPAYATTAAVAQLACAPLLPATPEPLRIYDALCAEMPPDAPEEDLSILVFAA